MKLLVSLLIIAIIAINESHQCGGPRNLCGGKHHHRLPLEDYPQNPMEDYRRNPGKGPGGKPRPKPGSGPDIVINFPSPWDAPESPSYDYPMPMSDYQQEVLSRRGPMRPPNWK